MTTMPTARRPVAESAAGKAAPAARAAIARAGGLVTPAELAREWGVSKQAIDKRIAAGRFPEPVKMAGRVRLYLRGDVEHLRRT